MTVVLGVGLGGATPGSGWGKPKNRFGMFSSMATLWWDFAVSVWRARKTGATIFKGSSKTALSCADTVGSGEGLIHERSIFQVKAIRPCLSARSTASLGKLTLASTRFNWTISW